MIAFVEGEVVEVRQSSVVLRTGPVGLEVSAPSGVLGALAAGETVRLHTHLVVREDLLALYGFGSADQHELFSLLITVSGVGPRLALAILSALPGNLLAGALADGDAGLLTSAPGVGKRTAERLILELKSRVPEHLLVDTSGQRTARLKPGAGEDAIEALLALGFRESQVRPVVAELTAANPAEPPEGLIRKALARLR